MPFLYRITYAFSGHGQGWSEVHVHQNDSDQPGNVSSQLRNLAQLRANLLGTPYQMDGYRVAQIRNDAGVPVQRIVYLWEQVMKPQTTANWDADATDVAIIARLTNGVGNLSKNIFMGGVPDDCVTVGGDLAGLSIDTWKSKYATWQTAALGLKVGWLGSDFTAESNITGYAVATNGQVEFHLEDAVLADFPAGSTTTVRIRALNNGSPLNGSVLVSVDDASTCHTVKAIAAGPFRTAGVMRVYTELKPYVQAAGGYPVKVGNHKRGKPLFSSRGRLPKRIRY